MSDEKVTIRHGDREVTVDLDALAAVAPAPGDVLIDVAHGSRLSRGWLAAFQATEDDPERPALHRTMLVEGFATGYRFSCTDGFWLAVAWVGNPRIDDPFTVEDPPERGEIARWKRQVVDPEFRIRDFMKWVAKRTKKLDAEHPDVPLMVELRADHDDDTPRLDPSLDLILVDVSQPGVERVSGHLNELDYPDVVRLAWQHDKDHAVDLSAVQLAPRLLRSLAAACTAVGAEGCRFHFHGDLTKPVSWEAVPPAEADLYGLIMPQRFDDGTDS